LKTDLDPATLLEHREFVRSVARRLLRDEGMADDVVQETYLRALRNPPRGSPGGAARAWLGRVCRNLAIDRLRREGRRDQRERAVARSENVPATHELADRLARHRMVVDAVLALDEPYRETVLLRFFEELPPRRIAKVLGVPVATVKSRLHRAFELLRARLERTHGQSWCVALLPLVALPDRALAATVAGGVVMKKLAGVLVVLALAGTSWLVIWGGGESEPVRRSTETSEDSEDPRSYETKRVPAAESDPDGEPERRDPEQKPETGGKARRAVPAKPRPYRVTGDSGNPDRAVLHVRVVDNFDRALADVEVSLTALIDGVGTNGPEGKTDAAGQIEFLDLKAPEVIAAHADFGDLNRSAQLKLTNGKRTQLTFKMPTGVGVKGTVRDVESGPIPHVMVSLSRSTDDGFRDSAYGHTNKDGEYEIDGVPPGTYKLGISGGPIGRTTVTVSADGTETKPEKPARRVEFHERNQGELKVEAPGPTVKDITLGKLSIEGTVRDAATGLPVAGVMVNLQSPRWARTATDERGRFSVASMGPGKYRILLKKEGYALKFVRDVELREDEVARVEFTIERAAKLTIHLKDPDGKPVTGEHWVRFDKAERKGWSSNLRSDAKGVIVSEVVPLGEMKISIAGPVWSGDPVEIEIKEGENGVTIPLKRISGTGVRSLSGIVRDKATGAPVVGARLRIQAGLTREAFTDKSGRFVFEDLRPGGHRINVSCDGYGDTTVRSVKVTAGEEAKLELELVPAGTVHLRVTDAAGAPVVGKIMLAYSGGTPRMGRGVHLVLDEDGRVSFRRLPAGPYSLTVHVEGRGKGSLKCEVGAGETTLSVQLSSE
jgi:RNA polymerase sigma-70 factor (ECF subfamily)